MAAAVAAIGLALGSADTRAAQKDVVETAVNAGQFKTLAAALGAADLVNTLKGSGPFTVFAPTDEAFAKLPAGTVENLLKPENKDQLVAILTYHVVPGKVMAADVIKLKEAKTVNGKMLDIETKGDSVMVNDARSHRDRYRCIKRRHSCHRYGHSAAEELTPEPGRRQCGDPNLAQSAANPAATNMEKAMKPLNLITLILLIVGGLNWGLVGLFNFDLVAALFGAGSMLARIVYILVGLSALWQVIPLFAAFGSDQPSALRGRSAH